MRSCETFPFLISIYVMVSITAVFIQALFRQLYYWGIISEICLSVLRVTISQHVSWSSGSPPLFPWCFPVLNTYCRCICSGRTPHDRLFSVFWPVVDFCLCLLQRDPCLIRMGAVLICVYESKYLECSYESCCFRKEGTLHFPLRSKSPLPPAGPPGGWVDSSQAWFPSCWSGRKFN